MQRLITLIAITAFGLAIAFTVATTVASAVSSSLNASADLIEHPERAGR